MLFIIIYHDKLSFHDNFEREYLTKLSYKLDFYSLDRSRFSTCWFLCVCSDHSYFFHTGLEDTWLKRIIWVEWQLAGLKVTAESSPVVIPHYLLVFLPCIVSTAFVLGFRAWNVMKVHLSHSPSSRRGSLKPPALLCTIMHVSFSSTAWIGKDNKKSHAAALANSLFWTLAQMLKFVLVSSENVTLEVTV